MPTESNAISSRISPPTGFAEMTSPSLKALCKMRSPADRLHAAGASAFCDAPVNDEENPEVVFFLGRISSPDQLPVLS